MGVWGGGHFLWMGGCSRMGSAEAAWRVQEAEPIHGAGVVWLYIDSRGEEGSSGRAMVNHNWQGVWCGWFIVDSTWRSGDYRSDATHSSS
jgi:hypothetical protein